jgi:hypothetical protein
MRSEASIRSNKKGAAWQANPVRVGASRRVLNLGQFIRSLAFAVLGFAFVMVISLQHARGGAGVDAPHRIAAAGPLMGQSILIFVDKRAAFISRARRFD